MLWNRVLKSLRACFSFQGDVNYVSLVVLGFTSFINFSVTEIILYVYNHL